MKYIMTEAEYQKIALAIYDAKKVMVNSEFQFIFQELSEALHTIRSLDRIDESK